jgi:hypothetical protein
MYDDLFQYDPLSVTMTNLSESGVITGTPPTPRMAHGLVVAGGELFVFGGNSLQGILELQSFTSLATIFDGWQQAIPQRLCLQGFRYDVDLA